MIHIFFSNFSRNAFSQLQTLRGDEVEAFMNPDDLEEWRGRKIHDMEENWLIGEIPEEHYCSKKWLIVPDGGLEMIDGEFLHDSFFELTDQDPLKFIRKNFIKELWRCDNEDCKLVHLEDEPKPNTPFCSRLYAPGDHEGLIIINANEKYPWWTEELPESLRQAYPVFYKSTSRG